MLAYRVVEVITAHSNALEHDGEVLSFYDHLVVINGFNEAPKTDHAFSTIDAVDFP